jgi:putative SOS response-associated peptidase YedK
MCGRFSLIAVSEFLSTRFNVTIEQDLIPRYNISPSQTIPVIFNDKPKVLSSARWGLIPHWAKDEKTSYSMINARSETLLEKPAYKVPFQRMRCLIPADGFYEWKKAGTQKVPYRVVLRDNGLFAFAGIYDRWQHGEKNIVSCSIITTGPNELMKHIHDRMPVILKREHENAWLSDTPLPELQKMLVPYPAEEMRAYQISELVNSVRNIGKEIIEPVKSLAEY